MQRRRRGAERRHLGHRTGRLHLDAALLTPVVTAVSASAPTIDQALAGFRACWQADRLPCATQADALAAAVAPLLTLGPDTPAFGASAANDPRGTSVRLPAAASTGDLVASTYASARTIADETAKIESTCSDPTSTPCSTAVNAINDAAATLGANQAEWRAYYVPAATDDYLGGSASQREELILALDDLDICADGPSEQCTAAAGALTAALPTFLAEFGQAVAAPPGEATLTIPRRTLGPPPAAIAPIVERTVLASYAAMEAMRTGTGRCVAPDVSCPIGEAELVALVPTLRSALTEWDAAPSE